ncbi:MAG: DUF438 domain-containing protein [Prevotella sp.]|nr:DUF438 domain-containing protein [Prevotella sp.]
MKKIDLSKSVYELVSEYPELADIMASLGFTEITKKLVLNSVGRMTTIPKGAKMKGIPMERILETFKEHGFEVAQSRTEMLKSYLQRLNNGESLEAVREDFAKNFDGVDSAEIMQAEQEMMKEGTPLTEVQKLCDVHSALFHGNTLNEKISNAVNTVASPGFREQHDGWVETAHQNIDRATELRDIDGHPLQTLYAENDALMAVLSEKTSLSEKLTKAREVAIHYAKKGDLLFPHLKVKYGIFGPSEVMWTVDDEIRDEMSRLVRQADDSDVWAANVEVVLKRAAEMVYKEDNILFPLCAANFTDEEWQQIYRDSKQYAVCLGVEPKRWEEAEQYEQPQPTYEDEVRMPGGHLTIEQLTAMLNTIPLEISFVDADNINRYFNEGPKVFKRPQMAIDREVFSCHPPKIEPMVRAIINDFRSGKRDQVPVWTEKNGRSMLITYMAVRDKQGQYVGTMEIVQDMEFARKHFAKS